MNLAQVRRFAARAESTLAAIWPACIRISGTIYPCASSGIVRSEDFDALGGGARTRGSRFFRVPKSHLVAPPAIGTTVEYFPNGDTTATPERYQLIEPSEDQHTTAWRLHCQPYDR
jgi:hypothetical protein